MNVRPAVLCVDDDPAILELLARTLRADFDVTTEERPLAALQLLERREREFATIVSDMSMPLMDGATFFSVAARASPKSPRVMLTGQPGLEAAIAAINTGQIFRFLRKPCVPHELLSAVQAGVEQHRLLTAEQRLLTGTLTGSVRLMSEIMGLLAPGIFAATAAVQGYVVFLAQQLGRTDAWRFELAACLHMVGCVGVPDDMLKRVLAGDSVSEEEARTFAEHPLSAHRMLHKIAHFEDVAEMIRLQSSQLAIGHAAVSEDIELGAAMLRVARAVAQRTAGGVSETEAVHELVVNATPRERKLLELLLGFSSVAKTGVLKELNASELTARMVLEDDVKTKTGFMVVTRGQQLSEILLERLVRFSRAGLLAEPIRVRVPGVS